MNANTSVTAAPVSTRLKHERRRDSRVRAELPVDLFVDGFPHHCRIVDLSLTGMAIELTKALALRHSHLIGNYAVHVSGTRVLTIKARTVWRRGAVQAVHFVGVTKEELVVLTELVEVAKRAAISDVDRLNLAESRDRPIEHHSAHRSMSARPPSV